jgi:hypothetical protein
MWVWMRIVDDDNAFVHTQVHQPTELIRVVGRENSNPQKRSRGEARIASSSI